MSNAVYPDLPGLEINSSMQPEFATKVQRAVSGRELRAAFMQFPLWTFRLSYSVLRSDAAHAELQALVGFFLERLGSFDSFLYFDPNFNSVSGQQFGVGNGVSSQFQLVRSFGGFVEPVQNVKAIDGIEAGGIPLESPVDYSVDGDGRVTFAEPPAPGALLAWRGAYYHRVRFTRDVAEASEFLRDLWEMKKVELVGAPGNKV